MPARRHLVLLAVLALGGCPAGTQRFPPRAPVTRDEDLRPWGPMPAPRTREPPRQAFWIGGDRREAMDVNALDEVPDSSWYANRRPTPAEAARGACADATDLTGSWTVQGRRGHTLQLEIAGGRFVLAPDEPGRPARATAAEAITARLYHAAGYLVPCTRVVYFAPSALRASPALARDVAEVLRAAARGPGGTLRAALREVPRGTVLGSFSFAGTRSDDRNDVVPHEHRRVLRASRLLAAWTDHRAAGEGATLDLWRSTGPGAGIVQHYFTDFRGTLGTARGDFAHAPFEPASFRPALPNPAMGSMTERDAHWMARKIAALGSQHLRAVIREGLLPDPRDAKALGRALRARRRALLERYLMTWTPVSRLRGQGRELCFDDLATIAGLTVPHLRPMLHRVTLNGRRLRVRTEDDGSVCAAVPAVPRPTSTGVGPKPRYFIVKIEGRASDEARFLPPVAVHVHGRGDGSLLVAGVER